MSTLAFQVIPSPESNDHQVRLIIDGIDRIPTDGLGIDPPEFFAQGPLRTGGTLLAARCECGCVGCDDTEYKVVRGESEVRWSTPDNRTFTFPNSEYDRVLKLSANDFSWEDANRTAERLVNEVLQGLQLKGGYSYDWASARIQKGKITLSFTNSGSEQQLPRFDWDGINPRTAVEGAKRFLSEHQSG